MFTLSFIPCDRESNKHNALKFWYLEPHYLECLHQELLPSKEFMHATFLTTKIVLFSFWFVQKWIPKNLDKKEDKKDDKVNCFLCAQNKFNHLSIKSQEILLHSEIILDLSGILFTQLFVLF